MYLCLPLLTLLAPPALSARGGDGGGGDPAPPDVAAATAEAEAEADADADDDAAVVDAMARIESLTNDE